MTVGQKYAGNHWLSRNGGDEINRVVGAEPQIKGEVWARTIRRWKKSYSELWGEMFR